MTAPELLVVIPAHDEADQIAGCLRSVITAARMITHRVHVVVVAHRCTDSTAAVAQRALDDSWSDGQVVQVREQSTVGAVRNAGVARALAELRPTPEWLFSTDADTVVPASWFADGLAHTARTGAQLVLGLVDLHGVDALVRARHDRLVAAGVAPDGTHTHAYAANLLVRLDALTAVGGFPAVPHGEEQALATIMRQAGHRIDAVAGWRVSTSGRTVGRAPHGLHVVLGNLARLPSAPDAAPQDAVPVEQRR